MKRRKRIGNRAGMLLKSFQLKRSYRFWADVPGSNQKLIAEILGGVMNQTLKGLIGWLVVMIWFTLVGLANGYIATNWF